MTNLNDTKASYTTQTTWAPKAEPVYACLESKRLPSFFVLPSNLSISYAMKMIMKHFKETPDSLATLLVSFSKLLLAY